VGDFPNLTATMKKSHRRHIVDPHQLLLFTEEEMMGDFRPTPTAPAPSVEQQADPLANDPVTAMLLRSLCLLGKFPTKKIQLIAMHCAALIQIGINASETYTLPLLPDTPIRGDLLVALAYASIAQTFPNMVDTMGLHWTAEYSKALELYSKT